MEMFYGDKTLISNFFADAIQISKTFITFL
jgi:hypothetical protein